MKLSAFVCALLVAASGSRAWGDDAFIAKTQVYTDSDHTTVVSPLVAIKRDVWKGGTITSSYVADVVSSASIDVVSNATTRMHDFRSEITGGLTQKLADTTVSGTYIYSIEHDYSSNNISLSVAQDLLQRNTTLALGYNLSLNNVYRTGDASFHRTLDVHSVDAAWTQVISPRTVAQLSYTLGINSGYQASPYRFVRVQTDDLSSVAFKVPESDPNLRVRHAVVAAINRHVGADSSIQADYRLYFDSWGISAHTLQVRQFINFGDFTLRLRERFYYQTAASFYQENYTVDSLSNYVTVDRELSTFWSVIGGAKLSWRVPWSGLALAFEIKLDAFYFHYIDFALLPSRTGANIEAGISLLY